MSGGRYRTAGVLFLIGMAILAIPNCDNSPPTKTQSNNETQSTQRTGTIRIGSLSPDDALGLSNRLTERGVHSDIAYLLRFVHFYKLGKRDPALAALEFANDKTAKAIVALLKEQKALEEQGGSIDADEVSELRAEMERRPVSDCEEMVNSGQFKPLTGKQFCPLWDSGILDLLPMPGELLTVSGRLLARKALLSLPKQRLMRVPRLATIMSKAEGRRALLSDQITRHIAMEDELIKQLLNFEWNVTVDLSEHN